MKLPHILVAALALLFCAALLYDQPLTTAATPERVEITYWEKWTGFEGEAMKATIALFNSRKIKNKNGQVIFCRCLTTTQVDRKSLLAIAGGNPPDLAGFWSNNTHVYAQLGALQPLDPYIQRDGFDMEKYIEVYRHYCQYQRIGDERKQVWCLPTTPAAVALHWNKDLFKAAGLERAPRTLKELEVFSEKLTLRDSTGKVTQMGFMPMEPGWWNWGWGYFWGGKLHTGLDQLTADDPRNIEAFEWLCQFARKYGPEEMLAFRQSFGTFDSPQNAFLSGKVAMVLQGVWMANFIRFHNPRLNYGCAPFPTADGGPPVTIAEMDVICIPRGAKHPDEAWEVIKFINSQEGMEYLCGSKENNGGQGKLTPFKHVSQDWLNHHPHPYLNVFIELAKSPKALMGPQVVVWEEYRKELGTAFELAWLGKATPREALQAVQQRMQPKLERALRNAGATHP